MVGSSTSGSVSEDGGSGSADKERFSSGEWCEIRKNQ